MEGRLGIAGGIAGPILLTIYFAAPALAKWPYAGASPKELVAYAHPPPLLFYAGGWLQATGAALSILFFLVLLQLSGARGRLSGLITIVGCALLLSVVVVEAALLEAVPMAASAGDQATVATTFALSNGVFARIFRSLPRRFYLLASGWRCSPRISYHEDSAGPPSSSPYCSNSPGLPRSSVRSG